jgi:hypothetical protein
MNYQYYQPEQSSNLVADGCFGTDTGYPHAQPEQSNLVAYGGFETGIGYPCVQIEHLHPTANSSFGTDLRYPYANTEYFKDAGDNVTMWNVEPLPTTTVELHTLNTFWKPQNIEEEKKETKGEKEEKKQQLSEVLLLASEKYCQTMEALNADANLNDDDRKKLMEKTHEEYMQVICDNPPTDSDSTTEDEFGDEKEEDEDLEDEIMN